MALHDHIDFADTTSIQMAMIMTLTKRAIIRKKNYKVLISTAAPANLFGKI
jgi:hypothetical protein